jgi:hypothetical protein
MYDPHSLFHHTLSLTSTDNCLLATMSHFDVFNGDADGLCALHQLRLAQPLQGQLISGVKRDVCLLSRVQACAGDSVAVFDISLAQNYADLNRLLAQGVRIAYFDHHYAERIPQHRLLEAHIDTGAGVCTSSIVDGLLDGRFRAWAVVAAFGDNLQRTACELATPLALTESALGQLRALGECLNYNSYGESDADLYYAPIALYRAMAPFADPLDFAAQRPEFERLCAGMSEDLRLARHCQATLAWPGGDAYLLPGAAWSRRVAGHFANVLARELPAASHAVLTPRSAGGYAVSIRMPFGGSTTADELCRQFPGGGGRRLAAGINVLPETELASFLSCFQTATRTSV